MYFFDRDNWSFLAKPSSNRTDPHSGIVAESLPKRRPREQNEKKICLFDCRLVVEKLGGALPPHSSIILLTDADLD